MNTAPKKAVSQEALLQMLAKLKKGDILTLADLFIKEGETSPPKRYTSGSMILAMENAGQLIEDEELRAQIKGSGIGTSATRAEILKKLFNINYLDITASWEKGLTYVAEGTITPDEYMQKLERFVAGRTVNVIRMDNQYHMRQFFDRAAAYYNPKAGKSRTGTSKQE